MNIAMSITLHTNLWLGAVACIGLMLGWVGQRSHFCTMGAISDAVLMQDYTRARQWLATVCIAIVLSQTLQQLSWLTIDAVLYRQATNLPIVSSLLGGMAFGAGMVLASGCGYKTWIRVGEGHTKSLMVLVCASIAAFAMMRGIPALGRQWLMQLDQSLGIALSSALPLLPSLPLQFPSSLATLLALCGLGWIIFIQHRQRPLMQITAFWIMPLVLAVSVVGLWWLAQHIGYIAEHPDTLAPMWLASPANQQESISLIAPMAQWLEWLLLGSDRSRTLSVGMVLGAGVALGSGLSAYQSAYRQRIQSAHQAPPPPRHTTLHSDDVRRHAIGGVLMGGGAVLALGCTIGQGVSGIASLSIASVITTLGMVLGASAMLKRLMVA